MALTSHQRSPGGDAPPTPALHRIVIVGGGAGGVELATRLGRRSKALSIEVLLVDKSPVHVWKPRLHELAAGLIGSGDDATSYLSQARANDFEFHWGELIGYDLARKTIRLAAMSDPAGIDEVLPEREIGYTTLVLAIGSRVNDFGVDGVLEFCEMLDGPNQAAAMQRKFIEGAIQVSAGIKERLSIGIVGAGATGVELAAELHHAVHAMCLYGNVSVAGRLAITLIDQAPRVLASADERTSAAAMQALTRLGVDVRLGTGVKSVSSEGFHLANGECIACDIKVWASGVTGHPVLAGPGGLPIGKGRRLSVDEHLACIGMQGVYAIGDCAGAPAAGGKGALPPTAQVAHQQAAYLAKALERSLRGQAVRPFVYVPRGMLVSLGAGEAAAELPSPRAGRPGLVARGGLAKLLYVALFHMHRVTLHGWWRAGALFLADRLRGVSLPQVKLH